MTDLDYDKKPKRYARIRDISLNGDNMDKAKNEDISLEHFEEEIYDLFEKKYLGSGFVSYNNALFFEDDEIYEEYRYHLDGLKTLLDYTRRKKDKSNSTQQMIDDNTIGIGELDKWNWKILKI